MFGARAGEFQKGFIINFHFARIIEHPQLYRHKRSTISKTLLQGYLVVFLSKRQSTELYQYLAASTLYMHICFSDKDCTSAYLIYIATVLYIHVHVHVYTHVHV